LNHEVPVLAFEVLIVSNLLGFLDVHKNYQSDFSTRFRKLLLSITGQIIVAFRKSNFKDNAGQWWCQWITHK
jgi:hypothetical protein